MPNVKVGNLKGPPGQGSDGAAGKPAYTFSSADFTVPAIGSSTTVNVQDTSWAAVNEWVYVDDIATETTVLLQITAKTANSLTLLNPAPTGVIVGPPGQDGTNGVDGAPGVAATITVRNTTTLAAGSAATVTNAGDTTHAILDFGIPQGVAGNPGVSADANNIARAGSDSLIYVPSNRFNAIGNPNFEIDQINVGNMVAAANGKIIDRWLSGKTGTMVVSAGQMAAALPDVVVPGSNSRITDSFFRIILTTQQATLGAGDYHYVYQTIEGPQWREFGSDVHSIAALVRSSITGLTFSISIRDVPATKSLVKLCTIPTANVWTLIKLPNLSAFPVANFVTTPGVAAYYFGICLACGTTMTAPAADSWQSGSFIAAPGMGNFAAQAVNSTFDIAFVQHEPGPYCSPLIDLPFEKNLDSCLRYYEKSWPYATKPGSNAPSYYTWLGLGGNTLARPTFTYLKEKAKVPTVTVYTHTGAINSIYQEGPAQATLTTSGIISATRRIVNITTSAQSGTGSSYGLMEFTSDTGW